MIKRYDLDDDQPEMIEVKNGDWVKFEDVEYLLRQMENQLNLAKTSINDARNSIREICE